MGCCMLMFTAVAPANYTLFKLTDNHKRSTSRDTSSASVSARSQKFHLQSIPRLRFCKCQLTDLPSATSAAYGLSLLGGGLFAFNKSRSKGSLFGGLTGAALMATAYFLMQRDETKAIGDAVGFGSALLFSSVFGIRLAATRKLTPAGPLLGLSVCAMVVFISAYLQDSV